MNFLLAIWQLFEILKMFNATKVVWKEASLYIVSRGEFGKTFGNKFENKY